MNLLSQQIFLFFSFLFFSFLFFSFLFSTFLFFSFLSFPFLSFRFVSFRFVSFPFLSFSFFSLLADVFLYSNENQFLDKLIKEDKGKLARKFNLSYRYIDDLISFNNKRFKEFISDIYPKELTISESTKSAFHPRYTYLDLLFTRDKSNSITTKLYDKRDAFGFEIVNFSFMSSNIPSAPGYGVYASQLIHYARCCSNYSDLLSHHRALCIYASQLIHYARCCSNYSDLLSHHRALVTRFLSQGYKVNCLSYTFKK